eukprot:COSAG05_NODE_25900_length_192_cov_75.483871_1_plen_55_part_10
MPRPAPTHPPPCVRTEKITNTTTGVIVAVWFLSLQTAAVLADDAISDIRMDLEGS